MYYTFLKYIRTRRYVGEPTGATATRCAQQSAAAAPTLACGGQLITLAAEGSGSGTGSEVPPAAHEDG
jgi:hypothetical protein